MVSLKKIVAAVIAITIPVTAVKYPAEVVKCIQGLTQKSQALQGPAQSISLVNAPLILIGQGPFPVRLAFIT